MIKGDGLKTIQSVQGVKSEWWGDERLMKGAGENAGMIKWNSIDESVMDGRMWKAGEMTVLAEWWRINQWFRSKGGVMMEWWRNYRVQMDWWRSGWGWRSDPWWWKNNGGVSLPLPVSVSFFFSLSSLLLSTILSLSLRLSAAFCHLLSFELSFFLLFHSCSLFLTVSPFSCPSIHLSLSLSCITWPSCFLFNSTLGGSNVKTKPSVHPVGKVFDFLIIIIIIIIDRALVLKVQRHGFMLMHRNAPAPARSVYPPVLLFPSSSGQKKSEEITQPGCHGNHSRLHLENYRLLQSRYFRRPKCLSF